MSTLKSGVISLFVVPVLTTLSCTLGQVPNTEGTSETGNEVHARELINRPDLEPLVESQPNSRGVKATLATKDIGIGTNRISFLLTSPSGFITVPAVTVTPVLVSETQGQPSDLSPVIATFRAWPYGDRGLYVTSIDFDRDGAWLLNVAVTEGKETSMVSIPIDVHASTNAPMNGEMAPKSNNRTLTDVQDIQELTTGSLHDPELYQISIADTILGRRPAVVVFASPAFCLNAVCGPQVEVLQSLKTTFGKGASFIHIDFYDNPREIQGDLTRAIISPTVREWGLPSSEWTFMIDEHGRVTNRFEGFANYNELANELATLLRVQPR